MLTPGASSPHLGRPKDFTPTMRSRSGSSGLFAPVGSCRIRRGPPESPLRQYSSIAWRSHLPLQEFRFPDPAQNIELLIRPAQSSTLLQSEGGTYLSPSPICNTSARLPLSFVLPQPIKSNASDVVKLSSMLCRSGMATLVDLSN